MSEVDDIVDALMERVRAEIAASMHRVVYGTFVGQETDPKLSEVLVEGQTYHDVRKLVGTTSMSGGDLLMCVAGPAYPLTIVDVISGNI